MSIPDNQQTQTPSNPSTPATPTPPLETTTQSSSTSTAPSQPGTPSEPPKADAPQTPVAPVVPAVVDPVTPVVAPVVVPPEVVEYDLEVDEASPLSDADLEAIAQYASKHNLPKEDAQALVTQREEAFKKGSEIATQKFTAKVEADRKALNEHPEFSGEKKEQSWAQVKKAIEVFGNEKVAAALGNPEYGYNVDLALMLKEMGQLLMPEVLPGQGASTTAAQSNEEKEKEARYRARYPQFFKNDK